MSVSPYPMNREQRRAHYREVKKDPVTIFCPKCNRKTKHVAIAENQQYARRPDYIENENPEKTKCMIVCCACGNILRTSVEAVPYTYVSKVD